jgi:sulfate adenylyltransferase subunit 2
MHAKLDKYKQKVERTTENIREMLKIVKKPYIAFSCGKDSSVMADMILQINPKIKCRLISSGETRIMHNIDDVMDYFKDKYNADIEEIYIDKAFSDEWKDATWEEYKAGIKHDVRVVDNTGYDSVFMGLRSDESRKRMISLAYHRTVDLPRNMYRYANRDFYRLCPIKNWSAADIGAYIVTHEITTLQWYKYHGYEARTAVHITDNGVRQNTLLWMKLNNPEGYAALTSRFPELKVFQ